MSFFKYPLFMSRKKKVAVLDSLIEHINKKKVCCPICKFRYKKGEQGKSFSLAKVENPEEYPRDFIEGVCPLCKLNNENDEYFSISFYKKDMELLERLILWKLKKKENTK